MPLLQFVFVFTSVVSYVAFKLSLFVPHLSFFTAPGELCSMIVTFPEYLQLYFFHSRLKVETGFFKVSKEKTPSSPATTGT